MYVIRNGIIVQPDRLLFGYELVVEDDRIAAIQRQGKFDATAAGDRRQRQIHAAWSCGYPFRLYRDRYLAAPDGAHGLLDGIVRGRA